VRCAGFELTVVLAGAVLRIQPAPA